MTWALVGLEAVYMISTASRMQVAGMSHQRHQLTRSTTNVWYNKVF